MNNWLRLLLLAATVGLGGMFGVLWGASAFFSLLVGFLFGVFYILIDTAERLSAIERTRKPAQPLQRSEEDLLRLADVYGVMHTLWAKSDGEPEILDQDTVVHALNAIDAAVKGEARCIPEDEFQERRRMALTIYREGTGQ